LSSFQSNVNVKVEEFKYEKDSYEDDEEDSDNNDFKGVQMYIDLYLYKEFNCRMKPPYTGKTSKLWSKNVQKNKENFTATKKRPLDDPENTDAKKQKTELSDNVVGGKVVIE